MVISLGLYQGVVVLGHKVELFLVVIDTVVKPIFTPTRSV